MKNWLKLFTGIVILAFAMALSFSTPKRKMYVVVNFDVEDYISPESEGIDDIPKWLAQIMSEEGVTGTFFVIGEKARSLEKRGRADVIAAMAEHDIGSHTNWGSVHPTITEKLENADWENGVRHMLEQESAGKKELERIFGTPVATLARHGGSYGPQLVCALGRMNAGFVGSPVSLPGRNVVWFCNTLNFSGQYDGFDDAYSEDDVFEPLFDGLKTKLPDLARTVDVLSFFAGHPCKIRTRQFWDFNFYYGENPDSRAWKTPEMRPQETMKTAQKNFRRLMRFLKNRDDIEITTFHSLMKLYAYQKESMTRKELCEIAAKSLTEKSICISEYFSAAEAFAGLVKAIADYRNNGSLPRKVHIIDRPLGPFKMPDSQPELSRVTLEEVYELAENADDFIATSGSLPPSLGAGDFRIGTGSLFALFCTVYLDMNSGKLATEYGVPSFDPYPKTNEKEIIQRIEGYKTWPVHRRDLDMDHIVEMTRMQLWTLKPAQIR